MGRLDGDGVPDLSLLRWRCCYCYRGVGEGLSVCRCGMPFCDVHISVHNEKAGCVTVFEMMKSCGCDEGESCAECDGKNLEDLLEVRSALQTENEEKLKRDVVRVLKRKGRDGDVAAESIEEIICPHSKEGAEEREGDVENRSGEQAIDIGNVEGLGCRLCDVKSRLWICVECGYVGCGRVQYGAVGNGHAQEHYEKERHSLFVLASTLDRHCRREVFCYLCDSNVKNVNVDERLRWSGSCGEEESEAKEKTPSEDREKQKASEPSAYVGIVNAGNTCYISSVLQMIGHVVVKKSLDVEAHFRVCWATNPLECIFCQLMRVFGKMKDTSVLDGVCKISIEDLLETVWREMPMFTRNEQHDAHEFLVFLLEKIQEGEETGVIPPVASLFCLEIGRRSACEDCADECVVYEKMPILCTAIGRSIRECVDTFFGEHEWTCDCGGRKRAKKFLTRLPEYLIVQVGRYSYENGNFKKLKDKIGIESIKLEKFVLETKPDTGLVETFVSEGYKEEDVRSALSVFQNDGEKVLSALGEWKYRRKEPKYRVVGCINHSGENVRTGHYTWWVHDGERPYLVDDVTVSGSNVELLEDAYIFLFS